MGIEAPIPISMKLGNPNDLFCRIIDAAQHPHLCIPVTEAGKNRKHYRQLVKRSLIFVSGMPFHFLILICDFLFLPLAFQWTAIVNLYYEVLVRTIYFLVDFIPQRTCCNGPLVYCAALSWLSAVEAWFKIMIAVTIMEGTVLRTSKLSKSCPLDRVGCQSLHDQL